MSYEEYYNRVKDDLRGYLSGYKVTEEEVEAYMQREEDVIKNHYKSSNKKFENGEITLNVFQVGSVCSTAWCLNLMYE